MTKQERRPQKKWKTTSKNLKNGRRHQKNEIGRRLPFLSPKKEEDDLKKMKLEDDFHFFLQRKKKTTSKKWKTTSKEMEDDLQQKLKTTSTKMEDDLKKKWKTTSNKKMEYNLKNKMEDEPINQNHPNWL